MAQFSFTNRILNESEIFFSDTFAKTFKGIHTNTSPSLESSSWKFLNTDPIKMEGLLFSDILLYVCVSVTSLVTAVVASKTLLRYHSHFRYVFRLVKTFLEDWTMFWFTFTWIALLNQPYGFAVCWRWTIQLYMRLRYRKYGNIATPNDSAGALDHPDSLQIIKSLKVLKGKCNIEELRERVLQTVCKTDPQTGDFMHPKFHQYLDICGGYYVWKPANFDINHHVRLIDELDEDSESIGENELMELISKHSNTPFEEKRGLWEILVIPRVHYKWEEAENKEENREEKFAILTRISHGIGDGFSFLKLVMRDMAGADAEEYVPPSKPSKSSWVMKICIFWYMLFKSPRSFYRDRALGDVNPMHNPDIKMTGKKVHIWSDPLDVEWLKGLKKELGCGMNVMFLSTLSGACRKYMKKQFGLDESQLPNTINTIIPIPAPNHPNNKLVNKFSIIMQPLEMKKSSSLERCREIERQNKIKSESPDLWIYLFLMDLIAVFPVSWTNWLIVNKQCTTVVSNLPGPKKPITIWGYPLEDTMFWLPNVGTSGVSVSYLSYGNKLRFGLAVDTGVVPDGKEGAEQLLCWMLEELHNLAEAVNVPHDESSMFIKMGPIDNDTHSKMDKDEVASEDYGYGGENSDISSTDDTEEDEEDIEELTLRGDEEIVGYKNLKESSKLEDMDDLDGYDPLYSSDRDIDQRFLISESMSVTDFHCRRNTINSATNITSSSYKRGKSASR